jgi:enterochelin esterase-like enzyme
MAPTRITRRDALAALGATALGGAMGGGLAAHPGDAEAAPYVPAKLTVASSAELDVRELEVKGTRELGTRFVVASPKHLSNGAKVPLVVLLHGLGEAADPATGARAWLERYGLLRSYARLRTPPLAKTGRGELPPDRLAALNASLAKRPFEGLVLVCPFTPNVRKHADPALSLDRYATWLVDVVLPKARAVAPALPSPEHTALEGCSMGGAVAIEVFVRRPSAFAGLGLTQPGIGAYRAEHHAERLGRALADSPAQHRAPAFHLLTSTGDPHKEATEALAAALAKRGVGRDLRLLPGPHDQPWLQEAGTPELLAWHERRLGG